MTNLILTFSFKTVMEKLRAKRLLPKPPAKVAFIPTAGDVYESRPWLEAERQALVDAGYGVYDVGLNGQPAEELKQALEPSTVIFVAGGNTTYLFERARASGLHKIIRNLLQDRIYVGSSAGSILAGPTVEPFIEEDLPELSKDFSLSSPNGLGLVDYIVLPHHQTYVESHDKIERAYGNRLKFCKLTDKEYRVVSLPS